MAHERELIPLQTLQAGPRGAGERLPVSYAIMLMIALSVILWSLIIVAGNWLLGS